MGRTWLLRPRWVVISFYWALNSARLVPLKLERVDTSAASCTLGMGDTTIPETGGSGSWSSWKVQAEQKHLGGNRLTLCRYFLFCFNSGNNSSEAGFEPADEADEAEEAPAPDTEHNNVSTVSLITHQNPLIKNKKKPAGLRLWPEFERKRRRRTFGRTEECWNVAPVDQSCRSTVECVCVSVCPAPRYPEDTQQEHVSLRSRRRQKGRAFGAGEAAAGRLRSAPGGLGDGPARLDHLQEETMWCIQSL